MKTCVIFNPAAKGDKARRFRRELDALAGTAVFKPTTGPGAARELAREAVDEGFEAVVAVGGDGTVNEVLNGMADAPNGLERVALGVVPLGTANVFARELRLPLAPRRAWQILLAGKRRHVDLMRVDYQLDGRPARRMAVQLAGAGLDARSVELVDWEFKKRAGFAAYIRAGLKALGEHQPRITVRGENQEHQGELVLIGNGRFYGGPFALFPHASLQDGLMDIRVFPRANWNTALACAAGILTARIGSAGNTTDFRARRLTLAADRPVPLQLDGEFVGHLPATFEVVPQALQVVAP